MKRSAPVSVPAGSFSPSEEPVAKRGSRSRAGNSPALPRLSIIRQPPPGGLNAPFSLSTDSRSPSATPAYGLSDDQSFDSNNESCWSQLPEPSCQPAVKKRKAGASTAEARFEEEASPTEAEGRRKLPRRRQQQPPESSSTPEEPVGNEEGIVAVPPHLQRLLAGCGRMPRRSRRKVEVATIDSDGQPLSQSAIRRMKRRITNRDSARRMRQVRQQEEGMVRYEVQQLVEDNARLAQRLRTAEAAHDKAVEDSTSWQQLWHAAMAANLRLSDRLAAYEHAQGNGVPPPIHLPIAADLDADPASLPSSVDFSLPALPSSSWQGKPMPSFAHAAMLSGGHPPPPLKKRRVITHQEQQQLFCHGSLKAEHELAFPPAALGPLSHLHRGSSLNEADLELRMHDMNASAGLGQLGDENDELLPDDQATRMQACGGNAPLLGYSNGPGYAYAGSQM